MYAEDDMLMLSGIQHFAFCPRQWALIHIEQQWSDNRHTVEGSILHSHVDDPFYRRKMNDVVVLRRVSIASKELGLYGFTDIIELHPSDSDENTILHPQYPGRWLPYPIEYKHGKVKPDERDEVQLAAQVICLEEMYGIRINYAAFYYAETNNREVICITDELRGKTIAYAYQMHNIFATGIVPKAEKKTHCKNCSMVDICLPGISEKASVTTYLKHNLYAETT